MELLNYIERKRNEYDNGRFSKICKCDPQCSAAVDILDPLYQDVLFSLCHRRAADYAYGLLKQIGLLKKIPKSIKLDPVTVDGRTLNTTWTQSEERELIKLYQAGVKNGDYRVFAMKHGKTRVAVKEKVRYLKKTDKIKERE